MGILLGSTTTTGNLLYGSGGVGPPGGETGRKMLLWVSFFYGLFLFFFETINATRGFFLFECGRRGCDVCGNECECMSMMFFFLCLIFSCTVGYL